MRFSNLILLIATTVIFCVGQVWAVIPPNDNFATRTTLVGVSVTTSGSNVDATREIDEPDPAFQGGKSVWWTWTAPSAGYLSLTSAGSSFDTMLTVYTGTSVSNLTLVAFNDDETNTSTVAFNVVAGTAYQIAVDGALAATGSISLALSLGPIQTPPVNDNFANRITLVGSHLNNVPGSNLGATAEPDEPFHADNLGLKSVWWTWTAPASGGVTLTTQGSSIDTVLGIYTGNSVSSLTFVAGNDEDPDFGIESRATFNAISNVTYQIAVDGYEGAAGGIKLRLDLDAPFPVPTNDHFANRRVLSGSNVSTNGSNTGATFEVGEPMHMLTFGGKTVWYSWTAPSSGGVTLSVSNNVLDTIVTVYRGTSLSNLTFVSGNDENYETVIDGDSITYFNVTIGTTYQIAVDGYDGNSGNFNLRLVLGSADPIPANDNFANRILVTGTNSTRTGSNVGATQEIGEPLHRGYYGGKSVWWTWTAPGPGFVTVDTIGSLCDTMLAVYTGSSLTDLVEIASDDESGGNYTSMVTFLTKANVTYQIAVDGYDNDNYDITMRVRFGQTSYSLTLATNPAVGGTIAISPLPDQGGNYAPGSVVTLTATPAPGSTFTSWSGGVSSTDNPIVFTMNSNKSITANFFVPPTTRVWTGGSNPSGNWSTSQNWNNGAPIAGDTLIFPAGADRLASNTNDFPANTVFKSITFGGSDYVLRGNSVILTNGIVSTNATGTNTFGLNAQLNTDQTFRCGDAGAQLIISGNLTVGNRTLTAETVGQIVLSGLISGNGGSLVKTNAGTLSLIGSNPNTFTGSTKVNEGILELGKTGVAIPGSLMIGDGAGGIGADVVLFTANSQLASSSAVTLTSSGILNLNGFSGTAGSLTMTAGSVVTGAGSLGLNGGLTINSASQPAEIAGNLSLQGATRTFNIANGSSPVDLLMAAVISDGGGAAGITKSGGGTLELSAANTYTGTSTLNQGNVILSHASALGSATQGTIVNSNVSVLVSSPTSNEPLTLAGGTVECNGGNRMWTGNVALSNTSSILIANNATFNMSGVISGAGNFIKLGPGTLILAGNANNTYSGTTRVNEGTLDLGKIGIAVSGPLIVGDGTGGVSTDVVRFMADSQIAGSVAVTINTSGRLDLNGFTGTIGSLNMTSGNVVTGSGSLGLNGGVTVNSASQTAEIAGQLSLQGANRTFSIANGAASIEMLVSAVITDGGGAAGIVKIGGGQLQLSASNNYSGTTTIDQGILALSHPLALGSTTQGTTVNANGTLLVSVSVTNEPLALAGGTLEAGTGTNVWTGNVLLTNNSIIALGANSLQLSGAISGPGAITKTGQGTLIFSGASGNTYTGLTIVNQGTLLLSKTSGNAVAGALTIGDGTGGATADVVRLNAPQQISANSDVTVQSSGLFDLQNFTNSIASLSGDGQVVVSGAAARLSVGSDNSSTTFNGVISGLGGLTKVGDGTFTLAADNTYASQTLVNQGILLVHGSQPASAIVVGELGELGGSGRVGNLSGAGTVSPGSSPGILLTGNLNFSSNLTYHVELNGPSPGSGYDQLSVIGSVNLAGTLEATLGFQPGANQSFTIIDNDGVDPVIGTFEGLPENSTLSINQSLFQISYAAGPGSNDVRLTHVSAGAPIISSITMLPNSSVHFEGTGSAGLSYVLEATAGLEPIQWTPILTNTADPNGFFEFTDPDGFLFPRRFYRVRWP